MNSLMNLSTTGFLFLLCLRPRSRNILRLVRIKSSFRALNPEALSTLTTTDVSEDERNREIDLLSSSRRKVASSDEINSATVKDENVSRIT